jgi:hypothetical protein
MANIQIPIEILEDESFELMPEYISIQIENCDQLPEKKNLTNVQTSLLEQIKDAIEKKRQRGELVQVPLERAIKKRPNNITFKRTRQPGSRHTMRHYESDTDSSGPIETGSGSDEEDDEQDDDNNLDDISSESTSDSDESDEEGQDDKQQSNPLIQEDMDADSLQLQEVQELEPVDGLSHLNLKEDEYRE